MDNSMKNLTYSGNSILVFLLAISFAVTACSTTGMQRSEDLQSSMKIVDNDIKKMVVQLDAIGASLDELTRPGQEDVKIAFEDYSDKVSDIKDLENDFSKHIDQMIKNGNTYFEVWDENNAQYDNAELQRSNNERREELGNIYKRIEQNNIGVKEALRTYVSDVSEIDTYLSNDLTTRGLTSISSLSDKTVQNGNTLRSELQKLQSAIEDARAEMTQSGISMD